jgi:deoxyribonuclease-1
MTGQGVFAMRRIALLLAITLPAAVAAQERPGVVGSFSTAKKRAFDTIYVDHRTTFYCECAFGEDKRIDPSHCGYEPKREPLDPDARHDPTRDIEWEHVVPASRFGRVRACWRNPKAFDECRKPNGKSLSGRKCCAKVDSDFAAMEADLMNLRPAIGELNQDRSDNPYGEVEGEPGMYGACDFKVQGGVAEPRLAIRGDIGRTYLYMSLVWGMALTGDERAVFEQWNRDDPPDDWEIERNELIRAIQTVGNPFVEFHSGISSSDSSEGCIPRDQCCRVCGASQACGDSCISASRTCRKGAGCACDAARLCE